MPNPPFTYSLAIFCVILWRNMIEFDNDTWLWIDRHSLDDVSRLRLSSSADALKSEAITQIECRRKNAKKLSETLAYKHFRFPSTLSAEQSTSDTLANFHASLVPDGSSVLDMTCGLGIDTFHIARKAKSVTACEMNSEIALTAQYNSRILQLNNVEIKCCDSVEYITHAQDNYDCIFIDPARRGTRGQRLFALSDCLPDVTTILSRLFTLAPKIIIKASPMLDITHTISELSCVKEIYAVGNTTECKEIVVVCERNYDSSPIISAVTINDKINDSYSFTRKQELDAIPILSNPEIGHILYEPYPAVMKAGPFKLLSIDTNTAKLDAHTHLYVSERRQKFPGRAHEIIDLFSFNKADIKRLSTDYSSYDISVRNFPLKAPELSKKLKQKSNGALRLFAVTLNGNQHVLIMTRPV